jgi:beta-lactamase superfamily II metal-dependent hydrolase
VVPIVTIVGMAGVAALVVLPAAAPAAIVVAGAGAQWVAAVARFFDGLPGAVLPWPEGPAGMAMMAAFSAAAIVGLWALARWGPRFPALLRAALHRPPASGPAGVPEPSTGPTPSTASKAPTASKKSTGAGIIFRPLARFPVWVLLAAGGLVAGMTAALAGQAGAGPPSGPADWDIAACDVGQGDAFVIRSGEQSGVVIDAGPDPGAADTCLDRLGIARVDLLLLTHLHQDHTGGVAGVAEGRSIGRILYSSARETLPADIAGAARANGISAERATAGLAGRTGPVHWRFLWPEAGSGAPSENDSSAVLEATLGQDAGTAFRALFTGDLEEEAAGQLLRRHPELSPGRIAVLKVAHHGARNGGAQIIRELRPRLALISAGRSNDYGHPHPETLEVLSGTGTAVARTDSNGQVTVDAADGSLVITTDRGNVDQ